MKYSETSPDGHLQVADVFLGTNFKVLMTEPSEKRTTFL